ncbi:hypothetical protein KIN20_036880 [Parelaphostrongylus tenuis]|uniref:Uncharacterized protein n=1 Tax=Parelaphostrongylus tenuis TaxID=148309 RepID=A0AAD5RH20_PARTN|nr:hypothetical protein KIN20_036880 [Parelaphostrongylus tenuis]
MTKINAVLSYIMDDDGLLDIQNKFKIKYHVSRDVLIIEICPKSFKFIRVGVPNSCSTILTTTSNSSYQAFLTYASPDVCSVEGQPFNFHKPKFMCLPGKGECLSHLLICTLAS